MKTYPLVLAALLFAGCAQGPTSTPTSGPAAAAGLDECSRLGAEIARTEEAKSAAAAKEKDAWKAIVPFAVAARYAQGKSAAAEAERQLAALQADAQRQGCAARG